MRSGATGHGHLGGDGPRSPVSCSPRSPPSGDCLHRQPSYPPLHPPTVVSSLSCLSLACSSARWPAGPLPTPRRICGCAGHPQSPSPTAPAAPDLEQVPMPSTCFLTLRLPRAVCVSCACVCVCVPWLLRCGQVGMGTDSTLHGPPSLGPQAGKGGAPVGIPRHPAQCLE